MEGKARAKFLRGSARKMRRVADLVRGMSVEHAAATLKLMPQRAARPLAKTILSARANALAVEGTAHHHPEDFVVAEVQIDDGPIARRFRPMSMGRAYRIRKRFCHVSVVVSDQVGEAGRSRSRSRKVIEAHGATEAKEEKE